MTGAGRTDSDAGAPDYSSGAEKSEVRSAVQRFLLMGFVAAAIVATPVTLWVLHVSQSHGLESARDMTQRLADYAIGPLVTDSLLAGEPAAIAQLDSRLDPWMDDGGIVRIKVWDHEGRIVYSDQKELLGQSFGMPGWGQELLAGGPATATLEEQNEAENAYESGAGQLVEVYVASTGSNGEPLIFEAYYRDDAVQKEKNKVLMAMAPAFLLSLAVLQLAQLFPAIRLARRIQAAQEVRRKLLQRAIDASDLERQRIARDLHDEVIQDLAGLSYALEAEELRGASERSSAVPRARSILQGTVTTLRAMTTALYPPDLTKVGLSTALQRLTNPLVDNGIEVRLDLVDDSDLDAEQAAMFYRVARESLVNVNKHSRATMVELSLRRVGSRTVLSVRDNGLGFDTEASRGAEHLGLKIMRDTIRETGGSLEVRSAPGKGTEIVAALRRHGSAHTDQ